MYYMYLVTLTLAFNPISKNFNLRHNSHLYESLEEGRSYYICIFRVMRHFRSYQQVRPCDLDLNL